MIKLFLQNTTIAAIIARSSTKRTIPITITTVKFVLFSFFTFSSTIEHNHIDNIILLIGDRYDISLTMIT